MRIVYGKPDDTRITLGEGIVIDRDASSVIVRWEMTPGGTYDALWIERCAGDTAIPKLTEGRWWYPTIYHDADGERWGNVRQYVYASRDFLTPLDILISTLMS